MSENEAIAAYLEGASIMAISERFGRGYKYWRSRLIKAGVQFRPAGGKREPIPEEEIARRYLAGESANDIGASLGLMPRTVTRFLHESRIQIRPPGSYGHKLRMDVDSDAIISRFNGGSSAKAVADAMGLHSNQVRRVLRENGIACGRAEGASRCRKLTGEKLEAWRSAISSATKAYFAKMPAEEKRVRMERVSRANIGRPIAESVLQKRSAASERNCHLAGRGENEMITILTAHGLDGTHQKAVGRFNVDIAVGGVAVEVWVEKRSPMRRERNVRKLEFLRSIGWSSIWIWTKDGAFSESAVATTVGFIRNNFPVALNDHVVIKQSGPLISVNT